MELFSGASRDPNTYFRRAEPFTAVLALGGMIYYGWAVFAPFTIPYGVLGPLGNLTKYLLENHRTLFYLGYLMAWMTHIGEAVYSVKVCRKKGINDGLTQFKWFFQTFLLGIFSLRYLLAYKPPSRCQ